jgi:dihydrolipoamide dehydrogenase
MLIYPSDLATHAKEDAKHLHINGIDNPRIDFASLVKETSERIGKDSQSIVPIYDEHENITLYRGTAKFVNSGTLEINEEQISADKIYIATGSIPQIPNIPGLVGTPYMTSKEALQKTELPKKMIVI